MKLDNIICWCDLISSHLLVFSRLCESSVAEYTRDFSKHVTSTGMNILNVSVALLMVLQCPDAEEEL